MGRSTAELGKCPAISQYLDSSGYSVIVVDENGDGVKSYLIQFTEIWKWEVEIILRMEIE